MIIDVLRQVADWLADPTTGVNAQLLLVPQDPSEGAVPPVTIRDETRAGWVGRGVVPRERVAGGPLLLVRLGQEGADVPLAGAGAFPRQSVPVDIWYLAARVETDLVVTHAVQTLRAVQRVLALEFTDVMGARTRNRTDLEAPVLGRVELVLEPLAGDEQVVARLTFAVPAVDPWGLAAS